MKLNTLIQMQLTCKKWSHFSSISVIFTIKKSITVFKEFKLKITQDTLSFIQTALWEKMTILFWVNKTYIKRKAQFVISCSCPLSYSFWYTLTISLPIFIVSDRCKLIFYWSILSYLLDVLVTRYTLCSGTWCYCFVNLLK